MQNARSTAQKHLTAHLSTAGASAARFFYGFPFALLYLSALVLITDVSLPRISAHFLAMVTAGSVAQILATSLLIACFSYKSFAIGTTYSKTEVIQAAVFGLALLGDRVSLGGLVGITASMLGVMLVSLSPASAKVGTGPDKGPDNGQDSKRAAILGLGSGALFALSGVFYRGAALELPDGHFTLRAALTLAVALGLQCALFGAYLRMVQPGQLSRVAIHWRRGVIAGASGAVASAGWFTAFTLASAAYVKAVGSIELVFAVLSSWLIFRERPSGRELTGIALVLVGIVFTVLTG
jgi:drug/metabolite transporter (DMT)-like permease